MAQSRPLPTRPVPRAARAVRFGHRSALEINCCAAQDEVDVGLVPPVPTVCPQARPSQPAEALGGTDVNVALSAVLVADHRRYDA